MLRCSVSADRRVAAKYCARSIASAAYAPRATRRPLVGRRTRVAPESAGRMTRPGDRCRGAARSRPPENQTYGSPRRQRGMPGQTRPRPETRAVRIDGVRQRKLGVDSDLAEALLEVGRKPRRAEAHEGSSLVVGGRNPHCGGAEWSPAVAKRALGDVGWVGGRREVFDHGVQALRAFATTYLATHRHFGRRAQSHRKRAGSACERGPEEDDRCAQRTGSGEEL